MRLAILSLLIFQISFGTTKPLGVPTIVSEKVVMAERIGPDEIHLDGQLDDPAWQKADFRSDMLQRKPLDGVAASESTKFAILFDNDNLYVGIYAYDSAVEKIKGILTRRDEESPSDWVSVGLDSYNDKRTAFGFGLNPAGVKMDMRWFNDENQDYNWDAIWEGKTAIQSNGWSAEFKIPFRELRFSNDGSQTFGVQIYREISRLNEEDWWANWPQNESGFVRHFGTLQGLDNIPKQPRLYVAPYINSSVRKFEELVDETHPMDYNVGKNIGADIKVGLTNDMTLDVTINPDFGQVEADPAQLNLSAFESYFPEKRPFFVEGSNIFNYSLGFGDGDLQNLSLFYSRRIGRSPQNYPDFADSSNYHVEMPTKTDIRVAAKLSGKTQNGWSIGILNALTSPETAHLKSDISRNYNEMVEPMTNYFVSRIQRDFNEGRTVVGGILTATHRQLDGQPQLNWLRRDAYTGGIDLSHRFWNNRYFVEMALAGTNVLGSVEAIQSTQTSSIHYFQRTGPGSGYLRMDSSATSLKGIAQKIMVGKSGGGNWRYALGLIGYSPGFEANDLGYHRAVDNQFEFLWIGYRQNEASKYYASYGINFNQSISYTNGGENLGSNYNSNGWYTFSNYWRINAGLNWSTTRYAVNLLRGGPRVFVDPAMNGWWTLQSDYRKDLMGGMNGYSGLNFDGSNWRGISVFTTYRPLNNLTLDLSGDIDHSIDNTTWYDAQYDDQTGITEYVVARLNLRSLSTTLRIDLTLTPELTVQYYGSPFITSGNYTQHRIVVDAESHEFDSRYHQFVGSEIVWDESAGVYRIDHDSDGVTNFSLNKNDFNYKQFNSNLVLRWEYRPGSTLFLVWSQGRTDFIEDGVFAVKDDMNTLFSKASDNIFLIKASYLFSL